MSRSGGIGMGGSAAGGRRAGAGGRRRAPVALVGFLPSFLPGRGGGVWGAENANGGEETRTRQEREDGGERTRTGNGVSPRNQRGVVETQIYWSPLRRARRRRAPRLAAAPCCVASRQHAPIVDFLTDRHRGPGDRPTRPQLFFYFFAKATFY